MYSKKMKKTGHFAKVTDVQKNSYRIFRVFLIVFLLILVYVHHSTVIADSHISSQGLIAYWKLDENTGTTAYDSVGLYNGTLFNGPVWYPASGKLSGALGFDGIDDYLEISSFDIHGGTGLTISLWFRANDFDIDDARFISKATGTTNQDHYWMVSTINRTALRFRLKTNGSTTTLMTDTGLIQTGVWYHIAATYDGSTMRIYKNGLEVTSVNKTGVIDSDPGVLTAIGNQPKGAGNKPFHGLIDDVRIYNIALNASELSELDIMPPSLMDITINANSNSAEISWVTDEEAISSIAYGSKTLFELGEISDSTYRTNHTFTLTGLMPATTYYFKIKSTDTSCNSDSLTHLMFMTTLDLTPPVITEILINARATSATITWVTNEPATSHILYGFNGESKEYKIGDSTLKLNHSITLTHLAPETKYYFQITSADASDNLQNISDLVFTTNNIFDVWYGDTQSFGIVGTPTKWINILGNVSDDITSLMYSLNNGADSSINIGSNSTRLTNPGDFNIDIARNSLNVGTNLVEIKAVDTHGFQYSKHITIDYQDGNTCPLPYSINWNTTNNISDVAEVVDGLWAIEQNGIRTVEIGYDRLIAIGDTTWTNYEVTVPVTVHSKDSRGGPAVGILMRWHGHTDDGNQPAAGWAGNIGAIMMYRWLSSGEEFQIYKASSSILARDNNTKLQQDITYIWKVRVETINASDARYSFKYWQYGEVEPENWNQVAEDTKCTMQTGSLMLLAHRVDVTFGDVAVVPIPLILSNIQVHTSDDEAIITWDTNVPAMSSFIYGLDDNYQLGGVNGDSLVTNHVAILSNLFPLTEYHYQITVVDKDENTVTSGDLTFSTADVSEPSILVSDDFTSPELDTTIWTFINPLNDALLTMTGSDISLSVPTGSHTAWGTKTIPFYNTTPRIMQVANNVDFEIEVKFHSGVSERYQEQGILIMQDDDDLLRLEFFSDGSNTNIFAASFTNGIANIRLNKTINTAAVAPLYMGVKRIGNLWTQSYSLDGTSWTPVVSFIHDMNVTQVGSHVGNEGADHLGLIDYFYNTVDLNTEVPVELANFSATSEFHRIVLTWITVSETNNVGFEVWRSNEKNGKYVMLSSYINNPGLRGQGTTVVRHEYIYIDESVVQDQTYWYKLVDVNSEGNRKSHGPISATVTSADKQIASNSSKIPKNYRLHPNFPNPFNPSTTLQFDVPDNIGKSTNVSLVIFNILGQPIKNLFQGKLSPGIYYAKWDGKTEAGSKAPSGIYYAVLQADNYVGTIKLMMVQ